MRVALISLLMLCALPAHALETADYERLNAALVDTVVVPGYERHALSTAALAESMERHCASPSTANLEGAQNAVHGIVQRESSSGPISVALVGDNSVRHSPRGTKHCSCQAHSAARASH